MKDATYNGWANYETWLVNLWMDNEQGSQEFFREEAQRVYRATTRSRSFTREERARMDYSDWLKDHWEENRPELPGAYGDLLGGALSAVNWDEIARHHIDAVLEEETHADG